MSVLDVESLLAAVSPEAPCGENLEYDPDYAAMEQAAAGTPEQAASRISADLKGWRTVTRTVDGVTEVSAEKGYLREFGNIVFGKQPAFRKPAFARLDRMRQHRAERIPQSHLAKSHPHRLHRCRQG